MKKVLLFIALMVTMSSCNTDQMKYGQGGKNACQYVKEQVPQLRDDIQNIEVIEEDSLLTDRILAFDQARFAKAGADFWEGSLSRDDYQNIVNDAALVLYDIKSSWAYPLAVNDSLKRLSKYDDCWRKVYTIRVTMKSGTTKEPRVLMENDGITPRTLEMDFIRSLDDYDRNIKQATEDCLLGRR